MSFKDDYKAELNSVSPDTDKIMRNVHEQLKENAPLKIRTDRAKRPVWNIIAPAAGVAACAVLLFVVIFNVQHFMPDMTNSGLHETEASTDITPAGSADSTETNSAYDMLYRKFFAMNEPESSEIMLNKYAGEFKLITDENDIVQQIVCFNGDLYDRVGNTTPIKSLIDNSIKYSAFIPQHTDKEYILLVAINDEFVYLIEKNSDYAVKYNKANEKLGIVENINSQTAFDKIDGNFKLLIDEDKNMIQEILSSQGIIYFGVVELLPIDSLNDNNDKFEVYSTTVEATKYLVMIEKTGKYIYLIEKNSGQIYKYMQCRG